MRTFVFLFGIFIFSLKSYSQLSPGAYSTSAYLPFLEGKKVGMVVNHTATVNQEHIVDFFLKEQVAIQRIFAPEHGFRGEAAAGEYVKDGKDKATGLPIISLYGKNKKPSQDDLKGLDIIVFDIQDVGVRFYTYISTLSYVMEAAAEANIPVLILDRPNPNAHYVDGPVLEFQYKSFVGLHPIPIVYGMTMAEYATMVNEEGWLKGGIKCKLYTVLCENYTHSTPYQLPIPPSPNLPNQRSILLYPSLCLLEGTPMNCGRGTQQQFQVFGSPDLDNSMLENDTMYVPVPLPGANSPKNKYKENFGRSLTYLSPEKLFQEKQLNLEYLIQSYENYPKNKEFFTDFFYKLCGTKQIAEDILAGKSEAEIREKWQVGIEKFKMIRSKYLLYPE